MVEDRQMDFFEAETKARATLEAATDKARAAFDKFVAKAQADLDAALESAQAKFDSAQLEASKAQVAAAEAEVLRVVTESNAAAGLDETGKPVEEDKTPPGRLRKLIVDTAAAITPQR